MNLGGISQGVLAGQDAYQQSQLAQQNIAYQQQLVALQKLNLQKAQAQQDQDQQNATMEAWLAPPSVASSQQSAAQAPPNVPNFQQQNGPQPPAPGQPSVPMQQGGGMPPPQQPTAPQAPPGLPGPMGMATGGPPQSMGMPQQQQGQPSPQIPPYQTVAGMQQRQQAQQQPQQVGGMPPPNGAGSVSSGAPPGMPQGTPGAPPNMQSAADTPEAARDAAIAQVMKIAQAPDPFDGMVQMVMQRAQQQGQNITYAQAAKFVATDGAAQNMLSRAKAKQDEARNIEKEARLAGQQAFTDKISELTQKETARRDTQTAKNEDANTGLRRQEIGIQGAKLNLERDKAKDESTGELGEGRAAAFMSGMSLGQGANQRGKAIAQIAKDRPDLTPLEIAQKGEVAQELAKERTSQRLLQGKVVGFENTALANLDQIQKEMEVQKKSGKTDIPAINGLISKWKEQTGQVYNEGLNLFGQETAAELAKLASSATAAGSGGTLQDREEWKKFFAPNGSFDQMQKYNDSARTAVKIRVQASNDAIQSTTNQLNQLWAKPGSSGASSENKTVHWDDLK